MWRQCFRGMAHWWWVDALLIFDFVKNYNFVFRMRALGGMSQLLRSLTQRFAIINFQFLHNPWCILVKCTSWVSRWFPRFCKVAFWGRSNWMDEVGLCRLQSGNWNKRSQFHFLLLIYCFNLDMTNNRFDMRTRLPLRQFFSLSHRFCKTSAPEESVRLRFWTSISMAHSPYSWQSKYFPYEHYLTW